MFPKSWLTRYTISEIILYGHIWSNLVVWAAAGLPRGHARFCCVILHIGKTLLIHGYVIAFFSLWFFSQGHFARPSSLYSIYTYTYTYTYAYTYTYTYTYAYAYVHTPAHAHAHIQTHTHTYMHIHIRIHVHIHIHTHIIHIHEYSTTPYPWQYLWPMV